MSRTILFLFSFIFLFAANLFAQPLPPTLANYDTAKFEWNWTQGTGGTATEFRIKCGNSPGIYPLVSPLAFASFPPGPLYSIATKQILASPGDYFCIVTAANVQPSGSIESVPSNEVHADIQKPPSPGTTFSVK